jgi:hypothetical protein
VIVGISCLPQPNLVVVVLPAHSNKIDKKYAKKSASGR